MYIYRVLIHSVLYSFISLFNRNLSVFSDGANVRCNIKLNAIQLKNRNHTSNINLTVFVGYQYDKLTIAYLIPELGWWHIDKSCEPITTHPSFSRKNHHIGSILLTFSYNKGVCFIKIQIRLTCGFFFRSLSVYLFLPSNRSPPLLMCIRVVRYWCFDGRMMIILEDIEGTQTL